MRHRSFFFYIEVNSPEGTSHFDVDDECSKKWHKYDILGKYPLLFFSTLIKYCDTVQEVFCYCFIIFQLNYHAAFDRFHISRHRELNHGLAWEILRALQGITGPTVDEFWEAWGVSCWTFNRLSLSGNLWLSLRGWIQWLCEERRRRKGRTAP